MSGLFYLIHSNLHDRDTEMYIAYAPLEGITTATYRKVYRRYFKGIDTFYTPFLAATASHKFRTREKKEYMPYDEYLVPQVLTASADDFLWAVRVLHDAGYSQINLNMGCPSGTVVNKGRGAGMLADKGRLDEFLKQVFESVQSLPQISVKTRIGYEKHDEIDELIEIWRKYPFSEIIVHPRAGSDMYNGKPDITTFKAVYNAFDGTDTLITYNGDIRTPADLDALRAQIPNLSRIMIGRGLLINPALAQELKGGDHYTSDTLQAFLNDLWIEYEAVLSGPRDILFKMKELWSWLGQSYPDHASELKTIRKTKDPAEYRSAVERILRD